MSETVSKAEAVLYFGGVPTDPDIKRIRDKWPDAELQPGQEIPCDEVAAAIGEPINSNRFRTVTARWRRLVEKGPTGLVVKQRRGAFAVLAPGEVVNSNESDLRGAIKKTRRAAIRGSRVEVAELSEDERKRHDIHVMLTSKLLLTANIHKNRPALPKMQ